jgi:2-hydroxy-6-oxonona-2,4-dienedioate hydrolase
VLTGPTMDPLARNIAWLFPRFVIGGLFERMSLSGLIIKDYLRMGLRLIPELQFMLSDRIEDKLPRVTAPAVLVRGARDTLVTQRWLEEIDRLVKAQKLMVIPGWGHAVNFSAAEQLVGAITPFVRAHAVSPGNSASASR